MKPYSTTIEPEAPEPPVNNYREPHNASRILTEEGMRRDMNNSRGEHAGVPELGLFELPGEPPQREREHARIEPELVGDERNRYSPVNTWGYPTGSPYEEEALPRRGGNPEEPRGDT